MSTESGPENEADQRLALVHRFFSETGSTYDRMVNAATFGIDRRWKRIIVDALPAAPAPERVLDLACGTGILTFAIARRYPRCRVVGVELRDEYLRIARDKATLLGFDNVEFVLGRAEDYASSEAFDCIVSSYLAKYADLPLLIRNAASMLKAGGLVLTHDFTYTYKGYLVRPWRVYLKLLQLIGTPLFPAWREIFHGLQRLIEQTRWCDELTRALEKKGFEDIRTRPLTLYSSALIMARKGSLPLKPRSNRESIDQRDFRHRSRK